jgi:hypothetical protein
MSYTLKKKIPPVYTTGRSGSSFCAELVKLNLGITLDEWFSPNRYDYLSSKGIYSSKNSYLLYVFFLLQGGDSKKGVKVTPHVFASNYWEQNISRNPIFIESIKKSDDAILLIRQNSFDTIKSYIYSGITGVWHSDAPIKPKKNLSDEELFQFVTTRAIHILNSEINLIQLIYETQGNYKLFFYEDIYVNREQFMRNFLSCFTLEPFINNPLVIPNKEKLTKDHVIEELIETILKKIILSNQKIETLLKQRDFMLNACGTYDHHHTLCGIPQYPVKKC